MDELIYYDKLGIMPRKKEKEADFIKRAEGWLALNSSYSLPRFDISESCRYMWRYADINPYWVPVSPMSQIDVETNFDVVKYDGFPVIYLNNSIPVKDYSEIINSQLFRAVQMQLSNNEASCKLSPLLFSYYKPMDVYRLETLYDSAKAINPEFDDLFSGFLAGAFNYRKPDGIDLYNEVNTLFNRINLRLLSAGIFSLFGWNYPLFFVFAGFEFYKYARDTSMRDDMKFAVGSIDRLIKNFGAEKTFQIAPRMTPSEFAKFCADYSYLGKIEGIRGQLLQERLKL